jgi:tRNA(fMet)-specific endonuclease VapC
MIILDTDYLTLLEHKKSRAAEIIYRELAQRNEPHTTTIVNYEEQMRGWTAYISQAKTLTKQVEAYSYLRQNLHLYCGLEIVLFDEAAARRFQDLRRSRIRIGTMDLKIASIVLANNASLLTRNLSDFQQVPGLRVEDWIRS